jgi:hypothetical protein
MPNNFTKIPCRPIFTFLSERPVIKAIGRLLYKPEIMVGFRQMEVEISKIESLYRILTNKVKESITKCP